MLTCDLFSFINCDWSNTPETTWGHKVILTIWICFFLWCFVCGLLQDCLNWALTMPHRTSQAMSWQPRGCWLSPPWMSPVLPGEWPAVTSCLLSTPAIGDQMASWENPAFAGVSISVCLLCPCCPGCLAEAGEKFVCRGQWFVSREGFQAVAGTVCRRAERGRLCSLWWGDHPKGTPVQAACQPSCLLLCHGECLPKASLGVREESWIALVAMQLKNVSGGNSAPSTEGDGGTQRTLIPLHYHTVSCKARGMM